MICAHCEGKRQKFEGNHILFFKYKRVFDNHQGLLTNATILNDNNIILVYKGI